MNEQQKINLLAALINEVERNTIAVNVGGRRKERPEKEAELVKRVLTDWLGHEPTDREISAARGV